MRFIDLIIVILPIILINIFFFTNYLKFSSFLKIYDLPDKNLKNHKEVAYPIGGLFLYLNLLLLFILEILNPQIKIFNLNNFQVISLLIVLSLIFLVGFLDDKFNLNYKKKFIVLIIIISGLLFFETNLQITELRIYLLYKTFSIDVVGIFLTVFFIISQKNT